MLTNVRFQGGVLKALKLQGSVRLLTLLLLLLSLGLAAEHGGWLPTIQSAQAQATTGVFVTPQNTTDLTKTPGKLITVNVNVSESPPLGAFEIILHYDHTILNFTSLDFRSGVLGTNVEVPVYCVDGQPRPEGQGCATGGLYSAIGTIALSLKINKVTPFIVQGSLFQVTFGVVRVGLAQIHLFAITLTTATPPDYTVPTVVSPVVLQDGFFTNANCPSGGLRTCNPLMVRLGVSPARVVPDSPAVFNATVIENNSGGQIQTYRWYWNDGTLPDTQNSSSTPKIGQPFLHTFSSNLFGLGNGCVSGGTCRVSLFVLDSYGITWETTLAVIIAHLKIVLAVSGIILDHQLSVVPGTIVHIKANIVNFSTIAENATLNIGLEQTKALNSSRYSLAPNGGAGSLNAVWDTSGYFPRAYAIVVSITSAISAQRVGSVFVTAQNDTSNNIATTYVILVTPLVQGALSLGLVQTTALGFLVIIAAVLGLTRFLRKPGYKLELDNQE